MQQPLTLAAGTESGKLVFDYKGGALPAGTKITLALRGQTQAPLAKGVQPKGPPEASNLLQACNPITVTVGAKKAASCSCRRMPIGGSGPVRFCRLIVIS